ncbi:MAG: ABC transporter permease, partial [Clostridia bacterium]|nr:ABC transporter permease [Clostridia bacterium]
YQTKTFKIKAIDEGSNGHIFMNAELFDKWTKDISVLSRDYVISSKSITPKILKDIRNFAYTKINTEITELLQNDFYKDSFSVEYNMIKADGDYEFYNSVVSFVQVCIATPLFVIAIIIFSILISILMSDMIKNKGKEILILKSLGATNRDVLKLFLINALIIVLSVFILGSLFGIGLVEGINRFWAFAGDIYVYNATFFVSPLSLLLMFVSTALISGIVMLINLKKLSGKNLRKSFQKQRN